MYTGQSTNIPLGNMGLYTDDSQTISPPQGFQLATNCQTQLGFVGKSPGSVQWNATPLDQPILGLWDWWPDEATQRMIAVTADGRVWRYTDRFHVSEVTPIGSAPVTLRINKKVIFVSGGREVGGAPRKLFIFTGNDPVQVITGDGTQRSNIALPALDWTMNNQPTFGVIYAARLYCFGNQNLPHQIYGSNVLNQEDFQTVGTTDFLQVYPGEGDGIMSAQVFKGNLGLIKYPLGIYFLNNSQGFSVPEKIGTSFGAASAECAVQVVDDLWIANSSGTISSLTATLATGGYMNGDVTKNLKVFRFLQENVAQLKAFDRSAVWYDAKKMALFTYHSPSGLYCDRILAIDFQSGTPRVVFYDKDQPNCLTMVKDITQVLRPFYGSNDGYIYQMDYATHVVGPLEGSLAKGYKMTFQTEDMDFGFLARQYAEVNKNFDFLEITFLPTGNWQLNADIFLDNVYSETVKFTLKQADVMSQDFVLNKSRLAGPGLRSQRVPIHGQGRRISVKFYDNGMPYQDVQVAAMTIYFRASDQGQRAS